MRISRSEREIADRPGDEGIWRRAGADTWRTIHGWAFVFSNFLLGVGVMAAGSYISEIAEAALFSGTVFGVVVLLFSWNVVRAPFRQRNEARNAFLGKDETEVTPRITTGSEGAYLTFDNEGCPTTLGVKLLKLRVGVEQPYCPYAQRLAWRMRFEGDTTRNFIPKFKSAHAILFFARRTPTPSGAQLDFRLESGETFTKSSIPSRSFQCFVEVEADPSLNETVILLCEVHLNEDGFPSSGSAEKYECDSYDGSVESWKELKFTD